MKEDKKIVKFFDDKEYRNSINKLNKLIPKAKELKLLIEVFGGKETLEEIDAILYEAYDFKNPVFSADAIGLKSEYIQVKKLLSEVDLKNYDKDLTKVAGDLDASIREYHTKYFSNDEAKTIIQVGKILNKLNDLDLSVRKSISKDRGDNFLFASKLYSITKNRMNR